MLKKVILSTIALMGVSTALIAPASAQVIVDSTASGGSYTGAATFSNVDGSVSAIASEVTFPGNYSINTAAVTTVSVVQAANVANALQTALTDITLLGTPLEFVPDVGGSIESQVAADLATLTATVDTVPEALSAYTGILNSWRGGLD